MFKTMVKTVFKTVLNTIIETVLKTVFKNEFEIMFEKLQNIVNKYMSFPKITDTKKRDVIVNEFIKTRQNMQQKFLLERLGDVNTQYQLSKLFKPVTDMQKDSKGIVCELKPIMEGNKTLPKTIPLPQYPSITAYDDDDGEEVRMYS